MSYENDKGKQPELRVNKVHAGLGEGQQKTPEGN